MWDVVFRTGEPPRQTSRRFKTLEEAEAFRATISPRRHPGSRGKSPRTTGELVNILASRTRLDENGCWVWTGPLAEGYGCMNWKGAPSGRIEYGAHRISYSVHVGPIPEGMHLDHLCRNRACVNPDHLEPVTPQDNILRSPIAQGALNARKTHCPTGHEYTLENTYLYGPHKTWRQCRTCIRIRNNSKAVAS